MAVAAPEDVDEVPSVSDRSRVGVYRSYGRLDGIGAPYFGTADAVEHDETDEEPSLFDVSPLPEIIGDETPADTPDGDKR